jgi:hypothetical protein
MASLTAQRDKVKKARPTSQRMQMLYDFDWQALRTSLDFTTAKSTSESLRRVKEYVSKNSNDINRIFRALNLMAATRMGFSGMVKTIKDDSKRVDLSKRDEMVKTYLDELTEKHNELKKTKEYAVDSEEKLLADLEKAPIDQFSKVYCSLAYRYENSSRSDARPELKDYLKLMQKVLYNKMSTANKEKVLNDVRKTMNTLRATRKESGKQWSSSTAWL